MPSNPKVEYGDFQTPDALARQIVGLLQARGLHPTVIVEPTCGVGSFIKAAISGFGQTPRYYAFDLNPAYLQALQERTATNQVRLQIACQNFFTHDWAAFFAEFNAEQILVIGNPPWVTNAALGALGSANLPAKTNFQGYRGFDAKTGKANFDIAEWMLIKLFESLQPNMAYVAMLCKMATARKVLHHAWQRQFNVLQASLHRIDAPKHFGAAVAACLLLAQIGQGPATTEAAVYDDLDGARKISRFGLSGKTLIADLDAYRQCQELDGRAAYTWRSGVKHDAANVMELTQNGTAFINGFKEIVEIESDYVYPLLKSSDLANNRLIPRKYVILPQTQLGAETAQIARHAPQTWHYLLKYADLLNKRKSSIYQKQPQFAIFGIGAYSFAPWKVAISGFYKRLRFSVVGNSDGKPIMLDNTCYLIPCASRAEAHFVADLLNSDLCQRFLEALVFFDAKRPITKEVLQRIDLQKLAERLDLAEQAQQYLQRP